MTKKSIIKRKHKKLYNDYLTKVNDNGFRHYHCPMCYDNNKILVEGKYTDSGE